MRKNIWIDITNSPHVVFFYGFVEKLKKEHQIVITCRPLANTIDLLDAYGLRYTIVGKHYGASKLAKIGGFFIRCFSLWNFLRKQKIDIAISHSSFYSPLVSRTLGVRCLYLNDNEYALGNVISFLFAGTVMVPEYLSIKKAVRQGCRRKKLIQYPGIKEGVYLWHYSPAASEPIAALMNGKKSIFIRPEPGTAQYYRGRENFLDDTLLELKDEFNVIVLPRDNTQRRHYSQAIFSPVIIPAKPINLNDIAEFCDLFIGAGGTMTREVAVLGIPTVSMYQDELLDVDKYLLQAGVMTHKPDLNAKEIRDLVAHSKQKLQKRSIMEKGKLAFELILETILK
jgi:uncharacterized protein